MEPSAAKTGLFKRMFKSKSEKVSFLWAMNMQVTFQTKGVLTDIVGKKSEILKTN